MDRTVRGRKTNEERGKGISLSTLWKLSLTGQVLLEREMEKEGVQVCFLFPGGRVYALINGRLGRPRHVLELRESGPSVSSRAQHDPERVKGEQWPTHLSRLFASSSAAPVRFASPEKYARFLIRRSGRARTASAYQSSGVRACVE